MGYFPDTVKGISWAGGLRVATRLVAALKILVLARILTPAQFGVFGIAALILSFAEIVTETGINVFLIQEKDRSDKFIDTAWVVSIARGILIALAIIVAAPFIVGFFNSPKAYPLLLLISLVPFIRGFINPSVVKLQKELRFDKEFWFRFLTFFVDASSAVGLTLLLKDPAGLILGMIIGVIFEVVLSFFIIKPTPRFVFNFTLVKVVVSRGKWVTASGIFDYLFRNVDDMAVGRMLQASSLGLYQMAYKISELPITEVAIVISRVTFPVYAKISDDLTRLRRAFIKTMFVICLLVIPVGIVIVLFPAQIIELILGSQWLAAASALQVLAIFGIFRALSGSISTLFLVLKKQELVSFVTFTGMMGLAIFVVPLTARFGLVGAAFAAVVGSLAGLFVALYYAWKILR